MNEKITIRELIVRIAERSGMTQKLTADLIRTLPDIVESGLERDGEVRIAGLGTFKLKWVKERRARNLKTGGSVVVPAHSRVVFMPEAGLKDKVNRDFRYLKYTVLEEEGKEVVSRQSSVVSEEEKEKEVVSRQPVLRTESEGSSVVSPVLEEEPVEKAPEAEPEEKKEVPEYRKRKLIWWIIPLIFVVIALLIVIFYMKNCQDELQFPKKDADQEQVIKPSQPAPAAAEPVPADTVAAEPKKGPAAETVKKPSQGFPQQEYVLDRPNHLFNVARETYGNPFLWALIYKENRENISDPEVVMPGITLVIPALEGTPDRMSRSDSSRVAEGYRMLYEYYSSKGDEKAKDHAFAAQAYTPK